jgi:hypothetical protein
VVSSQQQEKKENHMRRVFLVVAALALLVGVTGAYAWDRQAADDQMSYQATHGQSLPTMNYPVETGAR